MDVQTLLFNLLLVFGVILFLVGLFLMFSPGVLVKWNSIGNLWIGGAGSAEKYSSLTQRLISMNYFIFANHRFTGVLILGFSLIFLVVYAVYKFV